MDKHDSENPPTANSASCKCKWQAEKNFKCSLFNLLIDSADMQSENDHPWFGMNC